MKVDCDFNTKKTILFDDKHYFIYKMFCFDIKLGTIDANFLITSALKVFL